MEYTFATLNKKNSKDWFVYYSVRNSKGKLMPFKRRGDINKLTGQERKDYASALIQDINEDLKKGFLDVNKPGVIRDKKRDNFYWWFQEKLDAEKAKPESFYNWRKLNTVYNKLILLYPALSINEIDYKLLKDLEGKLLKGGDSVNYVSDTMDRISSIITIIVKSGDILYHKNPFNSYKIKTTKTERKRITIEDINKLSEKPLTGDDALARDMYLFSFYLGGMRFGDICRVEKSWFKGDYTEYEMHKAKNDRRIKIVPQLAKIIAKYKDSEGNYLFETKVKWEDELKSINSRNVYYNKHLKSACRTAEIPEITFHTSRHSFADFAKSNAIDIHTLKDLLGHSKVQTTEIYMRSFYKEQTDSAMDTLFGKKEEK
ncbi:MAG: tyrosine-type recombinase/integrase [Bacteroidota bacterium]